MTNLRKRWESSFKANSNSSFLTFDPSATRAQRGCIPTGQVYKEGRDPMLIITVERHDQGKKIWLNGITNSSLLQI